MKPYELSGRRFGRLVTLDFFRAREANGDSVRIWRCQCDCGRLADVKTDYLIAGDTKSCGCLLAETHATGGFRKTHGRSKNDVLYRTWRGMKNRCTNLRDKNYYLYGGRGISVCEHWSRFENFAADMGPRPGPRLSLDRIDSNGNYEPSNCRWASAVEQSRNRRIAIKIDVDGERISVTELLDRKLQNVIVDGLPILSFLAKNDLSVQIARKPRKDLLGLPLWRSR